jgi:uncharacterized membrane protein
MTEPQTDAVQSRAAIFGHPIHPMLVPFPIAFLPGALVTDIVFQQTGNAFWAEASFWLLCAGIATALLAAVFGLIDFASLRPARAHGAGWIHALGNVAAVALSAVNLWLRFGDPRDAIMPVGMVLSAAVALLLGVTGWYGGELAYRHRIGVMERPPGPREP